MSHHGDEDRKGSQPDHRHTAVLDHGDLGSGGVEMRLSVGNVEAEQPGGQDPTGDRGDEEIEEIDKLPFARCPGHQRGDIPEGAPSPAGVGSDDDIDRSGDEKGTIGLVDGEEHGREDQSRGQVVGNGRDEKGQQPRQPEELFVAESPGDQLVFEGVKDPPFYQGFDIGHRHKEEEVDLGDLLDEFGHFLVQRGGIEMIESVVDPDHHEHEGPGEECRLGLVDLVFLLGGHQDIGDDEDRQIQEADPGSCQVHAFHQVSSLSM